MFQHVNPTYGISIKQAKKDAKKLAKYEQITLSEAQDRVAFEHSRSTWAEQTRQTKQRITLDFKESLVGSQQINLPLSASVNLIVGQSGTGKSVLCYEIMAQLASNNIPVTYITNGVGRRITSTDAPDWAFYHNILFDVRDKFPLLIHIHDTEKSFDVNEVSLHGGILVLDEAMSLLNIVGLNDLLKASKHTFVVSQSFTVLEHLPKDILQENAVNSFIFSLPGHEIEKLNNFGQSYKGSMEFISQALSLLKSEKCVKSCFFYTENTEKIGLFELKKENISI